MTVVDAHALTGDVASLDSLADRRMAAGPADERRIADLVIDQIEFASLLLLNKCDLVSEVRCPPRQMDSLLQRSPTFAPLCQGCTVPWAKSL